MEGYSTICPDWQPIAPSEDTVSWARFADILQIGELISDVKRRPRVHNKGVVERIVVAMLALGGTIKCGADKSY